MRETFPEKKRGDTLSAAEVNMLSRFARSSVAGREGGGQFGYRGWFHASAADQAHIELTVKVSSDEGNGLYLCKPRYYNHDSELWDTDTDTEYEIDIKGILPDTYDVNESLILIVGDVLTVRYEEQRGLMVPVDPPTERLAKLDGALLVGSYATTSIYTDLTTDSGKNIRAYDYFLNVGQTIASGSRVSIGFRSGKYWVFGAQCPVV